MLKQKRQLQFTIIALIYKTIEDDVKIWTGIKKLENAEFRILGSLRKSKHGVFQEIISVK